MVLYTLIVSIRCTVPGTCLYCNAHKPVPSITKVVLAVVLHVMGLYKWLYNWCTSCLYCCSSPWSMLSRGRFVLADTLHSMVVQVVVYVV